MVQLEDRDTKQMSVLPSFVSFRSDSPLMLMALEVKVICVLCVWLEQAIWATCTWAFNHAQKKTKLDTLTRICEKEIGPKYF